MVELNHIIEDGMRAYPGLPSPKIGAYLDHEQSRALYQGKAEFYLGKMEMVCSLGTYLDSPFHRFSDGEDLSGVSLEKVAGIPGVVIDAPFSQDRSVTFSGDGSGFRGRAVLVRTGWDSRWGTDGYWDPGPYLAGDFIDRLIQSDAALVGVDFYNVDDTSDPFRPAHTRLLAAGIYIVENMCCLSALPREGFRFYAVPPRIVRGASFPVRAFAEIIGRQENCK